MKKIFEFPEIDLNQEPMDGWTALKILNTPQHPDRETVQKRVHLVQRRIGEKFIRLKLADSAIHEACQNDFGGDQYIDMNKDDNPFDITQYEFATGRFGNNTRPDPEELKTAYEEALDEIRLLKLCNYRVSYHTGLGWHDRWPKIGDLVDIPADLNTDLESEEPQEARPDAANHLYDDRYFDNHRAGDLGYTADPQYLRLTIADLLEQNQREYVVLADRAEVIPWIVALYKLAEYGWIQVSDSVIRRYGLPQKYNLKILSNFIKWAYRKDFKNKWEWEWITKSISVTFENDTVKDFSTTLEPSHRTKWAAVHN